MNKGLTGRLPSLSTGQKQRIGRSNVGTSQAHNLVHACEQSRADAVMPLLALDLLHGC